MLKRTHSFALFLTVLAVLSTAGAQTLELQEHRCAQRRLVELAPELSNSDLIAVTDALQTESDRLKLKRIESTAPTQEMLERACLVGRAQIDQVVAQTNDSGLTAYVKEIFRSKNAAKGEQTNERLLLEFAKGMGDSLLDLRHLPRSVWEQVYGRVLTVKGWVTANPVAYDITREMWRERSEFAREWTSDPRRKAEELRKNVSRTAMRITPRDIGYLTGLSEAGILTEGLTRQVVWPRMQAKFAAKATRVREETEDLKAALNDLKTENAALKVERRTDQLTGVPNRRALIEEAPALLLRAEAEGKTVCAIYGDLDSFKAINDLVSYGAGDEMIKLFAKLNQSFVREGDLVVRMGGEEFVVFLTDTDLAGATLFARRLQISLRTSDLRNGHVQTIARRFADAPASEEVRSAFRGEGFPSHGNVGTVSVGITRHVSGESVESLIGRAEEALHIAKKNPTKEGLHILVADRP